MIIPPLIGNLYNGYMGVSKNRSTPKSSILIKVFHYTLSILGYPYFGNTHINPYILVTGFNPCEKYSSKWESSPRFGMKIKKIFETTTQPTYWVDDHPLLPQGWEAKQWEFQGPCRTEPACIGGLTYQIPIEGNGKSHLGTKQLAPVITESPELPSEILVEE